MPGIEDSAHLLIILEEAIALIKEKCRTSVFNIPEDGRGRDVAREFRARRQIQEDDKDACFAAAFSR